MKKILEVDSLRTSFETVKKQVIYPVDGVSLEIWEGEIIGIVGESGCGKSMLASSIIRLLPDNAVLKGNTVNLNGTDLLKISKKEISEIRGNLLTMVFQDPLTFLNPVMTVEKQLAETYRLHTGASKKAAHERVLEVLAQVGIPAPERVAQSYAFELSGGMRQRVLIAMAIICDPLLVIADEPTTALDVTVQEQILQLLKKLVKEKNISMMLITHDMGIVADTCTRIYVMYCGQVVESGTTDEIFYQPQHPYTQKLLESVLTITEKREELTTINGFVPDIMNLPSGCRFSTRCPFAGTACEQRPDLYEVSPGHYARCFRCRKETNDEKTD